VKTDLRNAFNQVDRGAVLAAVAKRAPSLLPLVQWAYCTAGRLHIVGAPEGTPAVSSQRGVRQGDPLGPLLFALTLQDALVHAQQAAPDAGVFAVADDVYVLGRPAAARAAFASLRDDASGVGAVGLGIELGKSCVYGPDGAAAAECAAAFGIQHCPDGLMVAVTLRQEKDHAVDVPPRDMYYLYLMHPRRYITPPSVRARPE
jgi:Reverse transcriptase (RNA-dependent DNA polymerase)